jgi:hypothetical protein
LESEGEAKGSLLGKSEIGHAFDTFQHIFVHFVPTSNEINKLGSGNISHFL